MAYSCQNISQANGAALELRSSPRPAQRQDSEARQRRSRDRMHAEHGDIDDLLGRDAEAERRQEELEYEEGESVRDALDELYS